MDLKRIILKPIVDKVNATTKNTYLVDDFNIIMVADPLRSTLNHTGDYGGEHRCLYDLFTKDENGIRLRLTVKPDDFTVMENLVFDTYANEDEEEEGRMVYSATYRLKSEAIGLSASTKICPDLSQLYVQGCDVLATEAGGLIQTDSGLYLLDEGSECVDEVHTNAVTGWTPWTP